MCAYISSLKMELSEMGVRVSGVPRARPDAVDLPMLHTASSAANPEHNILPALSVISST